MEPGVILMFPNIAVFEGSRNFQLFKEIVLSLELNNSTYSTDGRSICGEGSGNISLNIISPKLP